MEEIIIEDSDNDEKEVFIVKGILTDEDFFAKVSSEEQEFYSKNAIHYEELEKMETIECTVCSRDVNHLQKGKVLRHPDLGVPICRRCRKFYFQGEWLRDEDGYFEHCRWCANGGDLLLCESCSNAFCKKCIRRNLGRQKVTEIEESDEWSCPMCQPQQIYKQRTLFFSIFKYFRDADEIERDKKVKQAERDKMKFVDESLQDSINVARMLEEYMKNIQAIWQKKRTIPEADLMKTIKRMRKGMHSAQYNLRTLDDHLMQCVGTTFPEADTAMLQSLANCDQDAKPIPGQEGVKPEPGPSQVAARQGAGPTAGGESASAVDDRNNLDDQAGTAMLLQSVKSEDDKDCQTPFKKEADEAEKEADEAENEADKAEKEADEAEKEADETENEADKAEKEADEAEKEVDEAEKSDESKKMSSKSSAKSKRKQDLIPTCDNNDSDDSSSCVNHLSEEADKSVKQSGSMSPSLPQSDPKSDGSPSKSMACPSQAKSGSSEKESLHAKGALKDKNADEGSKNDFNSSKKPRKDGGRMGQKRIEKGEEPKNRPKRIHHDNDNENEAEKSCKTRSSGDDSNGDAETSECDVENIQVETPLAQEGSDEEADNIKAKAMILEDSESDAELNTEDKQGSDSSVHDLFESSKNGETMAKDRESNGMRSEAPTKETRPPENLQPSPGISPDREKLTADPDGAAKPSSTDGDDSDLEKERVAAKMAVFRSSSSSSAANDLSAPHTPDSARKKKLRTKRELNSARRVASNESDASSDACSDEDDPLDKVKSPDPNNSESAPTRSSPPPVQRLSEADDSEESSASTSSYLEPGIETCPKVKKSAKVDLNPLTDTLLKELREFGEVDVMKHPDLVSSQGRSPTEDCSSTIERLCNLENLENRRENPNSRRAGGDCKAVAPSRHDRKKAPLGLGDISSDSDVAETMDPDQQSQSSDQSNCDNIALEHRNELSKRTVLQSSSDEVDNGGGEENDIEDNEAATDNSATPAASSKTAAVAAKQKSDRVPPSRPALLTMKLSESGSSDDEEKSGTKLDSDTEDDEVGDRSKRKTRAAKKRKRIIDSEESNDDDASEEEEEEATEPSDDESDSPVTRKKSRRRRGNSSSDEDESEEERPKKRRRIKKNSDSDSDKEENSQNKRRHIRKLIKDKHLAQETKEAAAEEKERRKRIIERQEVYNKTFSLPDNKDETVKQLVLDFNPDSKKVLVEVNKKLITKLKPHQAKGVKFMWDACFESVTQIAEGQSPGGAILAHCMGLGKTLQTIALTHTVLENSSVGVHRVMVICPVNTVKNWEDEYEKWLKGDLELDVYELSGEKDNWARADRLQSWFREGGVLIIGYDMFRNLTNENNKKFKLKQRNTFKQCLLDPGPDLVVCDEGHLLKNEKSAINKAVNRIKTLRRIILTGTPLQNNLKEYYEMVNFVKPNLLGTRKEFMNRFVNPIVNGQHSDSTDRDIRKMKQRSHVLNDLLKGCMQRLDYNVLVPFLQPKLEYVLSITLTPKQKELYRYYLDNFAKAGQVGFDGKLEGGKKGGLFYDVQNLSRIWNHPYILHLANLRKYEKNEKDDEEGSLKDFINDDESEESDSDNDIREVSESGEEIKRRTRRDGSEDLLAGLDGSEQLRGWWDPLIKEEERLDELSHGNKMLLLMDILKQCEMIGDKVLVFSQSLLSLDLIEEFLARTTEENAGSAKSGDQSHFGTWIQGRDYFRLDGSTSADSRKIWCKYFNKESNYRMRLFLISTRAGGLGINLVAANRVIIFDASWNPSHDVQSIFRVYRFGQTKPVYIYRFLAKGTMEEKIYDRQVTKQSLSARVVDEQQIERHFTLNELAELYEFVDEPDSARPTPPLPEDRMLKELLDRHKGLIWKVHNHDSLLENQLDENLTEEERKSAWEEYENEKKGFIHTNVGIDNINSFGLFLQNMLPRSSDGRVMASPINPYNIKEQLRLLNPGITEDQLEEKTMNAIQQIQNMHRTQTPVIVNETTLEVGNRQVPGYDQSYYQQEMAKAKAMLSQQYPGMYRFRGGKAYQVTGHSLGFMGQPRMPFFKPSISNSPPEEIILDDDPIPVVPERRPVRPAMPLRGLSSRPNRGRRGRPRLDPDTDLDFSPAPVDEQSSRHALLQQLQAQGMTITSTSAASTSNES